MRFEYYNANPLKRKVNDCTVRAISLATGHTWDETYEKLTRVAQEQAVMPDDVMYIEEYLSTRYEKICGCKGEMRVTVGEFIDTHPQGTYLITMSGHITCAIDGCVYDTFNPKDRFVWSAYRI